MVSIELKEELACLLQITELHVTQTQQTLTV